MPENKEKTEDLRFEDAMEIAGYGKFSMYIIFLSGLTVSTSLMGSIDVSFLLPAAECDLHLTSDDKGLMGSAFYIGAILASHLAGFLADTLGRRHVLVRALLWNVLTYILGSLAPNIWIFVVFKLISGILLSPAMIATLPFLGEFVPAKRRAQALLVTSSLSTLGILYSSLAGWMTLRGSWAVDLWFVTFTPWRLFYLLCGLPSLLCGTLFYFTPESPKFLLTRGKKGETMKILQRVHSVNSGKLPHTFPVESVSMDTDEISPPARGKGIVGALNHIVNQTLPVFKPPYLRNLSLCIVIAFISFLCVNGVYLWLPEVTNRIAQYKDTHEGRFYVCEMLKRRLVANVTPVSEEHLDCQISSHTTVFVPSLLVATVQPFVILITSIVIAFIDRRIIISFIAIGCSIFDYLITAIPDASAITILFGTIPALSMVSSTLLSSITVELFPTYIRAMAVSVTIISGRLGSMTGSQMFSSLIDSHCLLMFRIISGLLICSSVTPVFFKFKYKNQTKTNNEELPTINVTV